MSAPQEPGASRGCPHGCAPANGSTNSFSSGWRCWLMTTTGIVLMLLALQLLTGLLLAFYYVPSIDHAHTTVSFIEKVLPAGSWIRALHHHGSQWLTLFVFLHLAQLFWRAAYRTRKTLWVGTVIMFGLVLAAGATGYSLPWDARAFFSTRVGEGIMSGLPLLGSSVRSWFLGGSEISTLTLSRFFALHVLVTPFLIVAISAWQLHSWRMTKACGEPVSEDQGRVLRGPVGLHFGRNVVAASVAFVLLASYAYKYPAPLGPAAASAAADYLPRPGLQFLWLYQTLKYIPGSLGSVAGVILPGAFLLIMAALPWLNAAPLQRITHRPRHVIGVSLLLLSLILVVTMTTLSLVNDRRDPRTRQQLARQSDDERKFRQQPFVPKSLGEAGNSVSTINSSESQGQVTSPASYQKYCASCHGVHGEGAQQGRLKFPPLLGVSQKPRRSVIDIVGLLNDPRAYGLEPPMRSFATKLTDQEKREIADWVTTLKK